MENVTKALLIAAAVIVVLVIIGLGMYYLNTARKQMGSTRQLDDAQIAQYNAPFLNYSGVQNGSTVKNLISNVNGHNLEHSEDPNLQISINAVRGGGGGAAVGTGNGGGSNNQPCTTGNEPPSYSNADIMSSKRYRVRLEYVDDDETSYIVNIEVTQI